MLLLAAAQQTGLLDALVTAVMEVADPTIPGLSPPNPAVVARLILTLLVLPVAGLARTWDLRSYTGTMLAVLTGALGPTVSATPSDFSPAWPMQEQPHI